MNTFKNKSNGHTEQISMVTFLWAFLFGPFYFVFKGIWRHAVISFFAAIFTVGISAFIYPFFAKGIVRNHYLQNGWTAVKSVKRARPKGFELGRV
jgi:hypothetical protein